MWSTRDGVRQTVSTSESMLIKSREHAAQRLFLFLRCTESRLASRVDPTLSPLSFVFGPSNGILHMPESIGRQPPVDIREWQVSSGMECSINPTISPVFWWCKSEDDVHIVRVRVGFWQTRIQSFEVWRRTKSFWDLITKLWLSTKILRLLFETDTLIFSWRKSPMKQTLPSPIGTKLVRPVCEELKSFLQVFFKPFFSFNSRTYNSSFATFKKARIPKNRVFLCPFP